MPRDRKSTRLNSSHANISYAVFCFDDAAAPDIYTRSLHDALPIFGGLPADAALLPYWLGALFIKLLGPWFGPALAARIPFALLLVLVLVLTWYATYHLARTDAARSEEHTSELQSRQYLVCRLLL